MNQEYLLDAIGLLDDDLIQEAETYTAQKRKPNYRTWMAWAACFVVVIALGYRVSHFGLGSANSNNNNASGNSARPSNSPSASSSAGMTNEGQNGGNGMPSIAEPSTSGDPSSSVGANPSGSPSDPEEDWCAAIMVDGVLYWSTETPILGEVDESVIRTVTSYTDGQPEEDGQTNFDRDLTTRYAMTRDGLVVQIEGEWILFDPVPPWEN